MIRISNHTYPISGGGAKRHVMIEERLEEYQACCNEKLLDCRDFLNNGLCGSAKLDLSTDEQRFMVIEERLKGFQDLCTTKLNELTEFFNSNLNVLVKHFLLEFQDQVNFPSDDDDDDDDDGNNYEDTFGYDNINADWSDSESYAIPDISKIDTFPRIPTPEPVPVPVMVSSPGGGNKRFKCEMCPRRFSYRQSYKVHRRIHTGQNAMQCDICKKQYFIKQSLEIHMRTHSNERPWMCHMCSKTFIQSSAFQRHLRTHSETKPFQCEHCEWAFPVASDLKRHMQSHTGERPHQCPICHRRYSKRYHVRQHLKNAHKIDKDDLNEVFPRKNIYENDG